MESIPTIPFCCLPIVSVFQPEGYSKEYLKEFGSREGERRKK